MKQFILMCLIVCALVGYGAMPEGNVARASILAQDKSTTYVIALASDAIAAEKTAASELQKHLEEMSGALFPIKLETEVEVSEPQILVGAGERVKGLLPQQNWQELGTDGIVVKTVGQNLILAGGRPRGALYAVYTFLEDTLGVRWWTPSASTIPKQNSLQIGVLDTVYTPSLQTREAAYSSIVKDHIFAARMKNNGHWQYLKPELGGHNSILGWCHTFYELLPPEKYFKDHPEWYSDPNNENKPCTADSTMPNSSNSQLNLSNDAMRAELTKVALEWIAKDPSAGMISISQNDNMQYCQSEGDMEIIRREGSPSGALLHFVNQVAADIEKVYPDFLVETLAYQYSRKPPLHERPRKNVVIRLCSIEADFSRPIESSANADFQADVKGWSAIAPRLYFWDYVANFANMNVPHPNLNVIGPNIKFFVNNKAIALFAQGDAETEGNGDFVALRAWLISRLMWNPNQNQKKLEDEFLSGYYGAAAPYLRSYLDSIQKSFPENNKEAKLDAFQADYSYLSLDVMTRAFRLFSQAEAAVAHDSTLLDRVQREKITLINVWLLRYRNLIREAQIRNIHFEGPEDPLQAIAEFEKLAGKYNLKHLRYNAVLRPVDEYIGLLRAQFQETTPLPDFAKEKSLRDVIDVQENAFRIIPAKPDVGIVDDPNASNGKTARLVSDHVMWLIQYPLQDDDSFLKPNPWRVHIALRVEPKPGAQPGEVVTIGLYDDAKKREVFRTVKTLEDTQGEKYQFFDFGAHELSSGMYFWFSPLGRSDIEAIYIDRIILIRENK